MQTLERDRGHGATSSGRRSTVGPLDPPPRNCPAQVSLPVSEGGRPTTKHRRKSDKSRWVLGIPPRPCGAQVPHVLSWIGGRDGRPHSCPRSSAAFGLFSHSREKSTGKTSPWAAFPFEVSPNNGPARKPPAPLGRADFPQHHPAPQGRARLPPGPALRAALGGTFSFRRESHKHRDTKELICV